MIEKFWNLFKGDNSAEIMKNVHMTNSLYGDGIITKENAIQNLKSAYNKVGDDLKIKVADHIKYIERGW